MKRKWEIKDRGKTKQNGKGQDGKKWSRQDIIFVSLWSEINTLTDF